MIQLSLFRIRAFTAGNVAAFAASIARGGLQFMLIIWLQGIWLPLHGYNYSETPLWAGIFLIPLTAGFLVSGPVSGTLSDRFGTRGIATAGMLVFGASFVGLMFLPVDFPYSAFAILLAANGIGNGMFAAPNTSSMMSSVPASQRGVASGMRATFQNSGTALSIGVFFSLMIAGLASSLPQTLTSGLQRQGVPHGIAHQVAALPPVSSLFAAVLGVNPLQHLLLGPRAVLASAAHSGHHRQGVLSAAALAPFHHGLVVVFAVAAALSALAAVASLLRGGRYVPPEEPATGQPPRKEHDGPDHPGPQPRAGRDRPAEGAHRGPEGAASMRSSSGRPAWPGPSAATACPWCWSTPRAGPRAHRGQPSQPGRPAAGPGLDRHRAELDPQPGDLLVTKQPWGAFHGTPLDSLLHDRGVTQIVLTGVATSAGVESTARSAHEHGYHVVLATDAMTDRDPEVHRHSVERIFPRIGETATTAEILDMLEKTR